jgi:hypothetical protein
VNDGIRGQSPIEDDLDGVQVVQARARTTSTLRHPEVPDHGLVGRIRRHIHGELQA